MIVVLQGRKIVTTGAGTTLGAVVKQVGQRDVCKTCTVVAKPLVP